MKLRPAAILALELADVADRVTGPAFKSGVLVWELKDDGSPVTVVDRQVEETLLAEVHQRRPEDAFVGEEVGSHPGGPRRWIVDGIDGTHSFVTGRPTWGTLIALEVDGEVAFGVATSPGMGRRWWGVPGEGAWTASLDAGHSGELTPLRVSQATSIASARAVVLPPVADNQGWRRGVGERVAFRLKMTSVTGHGPLLVAAGQLDVSVHLWGGPWDHAAFAAIVEGAGGRFSDLWGGRRLDTKTALFTNGAVHDDVLALVRDQLGADD